MCTEKPTLRHGNSIYAASLYAGLTNGKSMISNTAIKRIKADVRELRKSPSDQYVAFPLEDNLFEWHFTIRGPPDTAFEGGVYHGRILLPSDYPFKPPNIVFMTPNGRFKVGEKICLSISAHHPEHWQPAWGIRLILEALISFMPTEGNGALGSLDWTDEERRELARASLDFECDHCGKVVDLLPELEEGTSPAESKYAAEIAQLTMGAPKAKKAPSSVDRKAAATEKDEDKQGQADSGEKPEEAKEPGNNRTGAAAAEEIPAATASPRVEERLRPSAPVVPRQRAPTEKELLLERLSKPSALEDGLYNACTLLAILLILNVCQVIYSRAYPQPRL